MTLQDHLPVAETFLASIANIPSSTKKLMQAIYLKQHGVERDKQGNAIVTRENPKWRDIVARSLGFSSQDVADFWDVAIDNRQMGEAKKEAVDIIMRGYVRMFDAAHLDNEKEQRAYTQMIKSVYSMFPDAKDHSEILESLHNRMQVGGSRIEKELRKRMESLGTTLSKSANEMNPLIRKYIEEREEAINNL